MISKFHIKNFRLFDEVLLHKLSHVNLIVGKNSAGKSTLLEAFLLYFSEMSMDALKEILLARQEYWGDYQNKFSKGSNSNPICHLFQGHKLPEPGEEGFQLSGNELGICIKTAIYGREESEKGLIKRVLLKPEEIDDYDSDLLQKYIVTEKGSSSKILLSVSDEIDDIERRARRGTKETGTSCQFVPTNGVSDEKVSLLWDGISLTDLEKEVLKGIQLIEPKTTGVTFVDTINRSISSISSLRNNIRVPLIKMSNIDKPLPLKSLGDGMTRIFQIILSLVHAKDGVLIVDEFENGLHWSIQKGVWEIIFQLAERLNVQVFCSTHSRDCIDSFRKAWGNNEDAGSFTRVFRENGSASVREYDLELLSDSIETDVEVR